jgi:hypothetical protein
MRLHRRVAHIAAVAAAAIAATAQPVPAQPPTPAESDRERAFVESLRRDDPATADRYVALRDARAAAIAELRKVEAQYNGAGPELRGIFVRPLRDAQRKYAETSLALLDFYDARDRDAIARYQEEIARITTAIESRKKTREELEKLLAR